MKTTRVVRDYNAEEATNFVLEPSSDSELSGFTEGSDTKDQIEQLADTRDNDDLAVNPVSYKRQGRT